MRESPGFITTRVNASLGNEAFYMLMEGVASARDIDKALKLGLNHPMGPFELVDLVGLDTRLSILEYLHKSMGEKYRPCPLLAQYVKAGRLGRKVGRGVYDYKETAFRNLPRLGHRIISIVISLYRRLGWPGRSSTTEFFTSPAAHGG